MDPKLPDNSALDVDELCAGLVMQTVCPDNHHQQHQVEAVSAGAEHPRFSDQYKNEGRMAERQRARRQEHLERQNKARDDWLERRRHIEGGGPNSSSDSEQNAFRQKPRKDSGGGGGAGRTSRNPYSGMLMLSDWLVDIPGTLSTEWTMVPSPKGRRALVVAKKGVTHVFYKNGHQATSFQSGLPGGGYKQKNSLTILDCIHDAAAKRLYLLDLLWWNRQMFTDTEFTLRRFFLQSRIEEMDLAGADSGASDKNSHQLLVLPSCACAPDQMEQFMRSPLPYTLDGLLFYYNSAYYIPEQTPLVGWLKPWMLPEILGVPVPEKYAKEAQNTNTKEFIEKFNATHHHMSSAQKQQKDKEMEEKKREWAEKEEMDQEEEVE